MATRAPAAGGLLVVEDNAVEREGLGVVLGREGYAVALAADGAEALGRLRNGPAPDLILLDLLLPNVDGWQLLRELKMDPRLRGVPVVIMTIARSTNREWAHAHGAAGYVSKPHDLSELLAEIRRCLAPPR